MVLLLVGLFGCSEEDNPVVPDPYAADRQAAYDLALEYARLAWTCTEDNLTAACSASYTSVYTPGPQTGMAYAWGQGDEIPEFLAHIADGYGAGCHVNDGILDCTAGIDPPSLVGRAWGSGARTLQAILDESVEIDPCQAKLGDVWYNAEGHCVIQGPAAASGLLTIVHTDPAAMRVVEETVEERALEGYTAIRYESWVVDTGG